MKKSHILLFVLSFFCVSVFAQEKALIIPAPQSVKYGEGELKWGKSVNIVCSPGLLNEASILKDCLLNEYKSNASINKKSRANVMLSIDKKLASKPAGAYELTVDSKGVKILAAENSGIYYGVQSLLQILRKEKDALVLQKMAVEDYPAFQWRSFMLDESRHFKGKEVVKDLLDRLGRQKMNVFHWHLTDDQGWRIEIKKYPKLTEIGSYRDSTQIGGYLGTKYDGVPHRGFYTQEDIKEIVEYASKRHITIIPEIEMPGHATAAIASYPWLGVTGDSIKVSCFFGSKHYDIYNVADPKVLGFIEDVVDELIPLFPAHIIHIGGDEVRYDQWEQSAFVQDYMKNNRIAGPSDLQVQFTNNLSRFIKDKGARMIGWNEITGAKVNDYQLTDTTNANSKLAQGTLVQFWKGDLSLIQKTAEEGYDVVNSFHASTYLDYTYEMLPLENLIPLILFLKVYLKI
jgi:N-acetyl-beta-hexosaminidase